ncbi:hypothetical protein QJS10_CPA10g01829 [Acorus calamus]|uniref:Pentatricopeptide repeat-containing protein n=1 Tax=Acorus calamus TaxID=4465 RepID=A0AAV9E135_ACOCL|nr:hypothetical protein QJS10_CPA10g01829 [Acorus calamus]
MRPCADFDDESSTLPLLVRLFVDRGDLDAAYDVVLLFRYAAGRSSLRAMLVILIEAFSEQQQQHPPIEMASALIGRMAHDESLYPLIDSIVAGISALHDLSFVDEAVALVKDQFSFWVSKDQRKGKRVAAEFAKEGLLRPATTSYNVMLESELIDNRRGFDVILAEMDDMGITPDIGTFNIITANLFPLPPKRDLFMMRGWHDPVHLIRSDELVQLLDEMTRRGCKPNLEMYFLTARLLYRKGEANRAREMIERAQSFVGGFDAKSCHKFMKESCEHDMVELRGGFMEKNKKRDAEDYSGFRDHIEIAYQDLCAAHGRLLHLEAKDMFPMVLEAYIRGIVLIAWGVRSVTESTSLSELDSWIESLVGMESDGMDVGFLIERIKNLREMVDAYQRDQIAGVEEEEEKEGDHHNNKRKLRFHHLEGKAKKHLHRLMGRLILSKGNALVESISEVALARW